jgi:prophage antirepressor-like protein
MNEMIFKSEEFGKVRTYGVNGETWFVGQDVAHALGYRNTRTALAAHVEKEDKTTVLIQVDGTAYKTHAVVISESGLYALVMGSKLATARRFKHWITAEVLPAVRKEGGYLVTRPGDTDEDILARGILVMQATLQRRAEEIARLKPKADYVDHVLDSVSCFTTTQIAKEMGMTGCELNFLLRTLGIQYRQSGQYMLYADYARQGLAQSRTLCIRFTDGRVKTHHYLVWTERGREFIHRLVSLECGK